jgi:hypothetical protein
MSGKLSQYTTTATGINAGDWLDVSIDNGDGTFTSAKLPGSVLLALLTGGVNLGTANLTQTDTTRTYDGDNNDLIFTNLKGLTFSSITGGITINTIVAQNGDLSVNDRLITTDAIFELGIQNISSSPTTGDVTKSGYGVDTSLSPITIDLPSAASCAGYKATIFDYKGNAAINPITLDAAGGDLINGAGTSLIDTNYGWCILYSDGLAWRKLNVPGASGRVTGWAQYSDNGLITTTVANTPQQLQIAKDVVIENELPEGITTYWNDTTYAVPGRLNDGITLQLSFEAKPQANNLWLDVWVDLGGSFTKIYAQTFTFPKGSGTVRNIVYALPSLFQGSTWVANGGKIRIESNGAVEISNARLNITRVHKG